MRRVLGAIVAWAVLGISSVPSVAAAADPAIPCPAPATGAGANEFQAETSCVAVGDDGSVQGTASDGSTFTLKPICEKDYGSVNPQNFAGCSGQLECGTNGIIYLVTINRPDGTVESYNQCFDTPRRRPGPDEVAREFRQVPVARSVVTVQPPGGRTLVNLPTVLSTTAEPFTARRVIRGYEVVFTIAAEKFAWRHGDGTSQSTSDPGRPWQRGDEPTELVNHVYSQTANRLGVSVDVTWGATWSLDGVDQGPVQGTVTTTGDPVRLDVVEAAPQLVLR